MDTLPSLKQPLTLDWAEASRPLRGMPCNGDAAWTHLQDKRAQVAVLDGLGHGRDAAEASGEACRALAGLVGAALEEQLLVLHLALRRTRGAAVALLDLDLAQGRLRWCGVGNIQGQLDGPSGRERLLNSNGIVGLSLPAHPRVRELPLAAGSLLLLATDGVHEAFGAEADAQADPAALAPALLRRHARPSDDALLWVGRLHA